MLQLLQEKSQKLHKVKSVCVVEVKEKPQEDFIGNIWRIMMNKIFLTIPNKCPVCGGPASVRIAPGSDVEVLWCAEQRDSTTD